MNDAMFSKLVKILNEDGITADELFLEMEKAVPIGGRCIDCVNRHNAMRGGANIFCSCMNGEYDYSVVTDYDARDCKHFLQKNDETDKIEKQAIEMLIKQMKGN